jgi:hypothetical protein
MQDCNIGEIHQDVVPLLKRILENGMGIAYTSEFICCLEAMILSFLFYPRSNYYLSFHKFIISNERRKEEDQRYLCLN